MRTIKSISNEANQLRENFQKLVVNKYIKSNGSIKGYRGQIYILLPKFDKRKRLYKGVAKETYQELYDYLLSTQSQRRFSHYRFSNSMDIIKSFMLQDFSICYNRVWHNGTTVYSGKHWAAQASALLKGVSKYGFSYYDHDYNFGRYLYEKLENADPFLVSIYTKILDKKMAGMKVVSHEN